MPNCSNHSPIKSPPFRGALTSSGVMALSGLGDAVLYPLLPVYGETLGFSTIAIGMLLSANRFIRILANTYIARIIMQIGMKRMILVSSILAVITTISYGFELGFISFLMARILWGLSYSGLHISSLNYAATAESNKGLAFGTAQGIKSLGALAALGIGPILMYEMGLKQGFYILGIVGVLGITLALTLPKVNFQSEALSLKNIFIPSTVNLLIFILSIAIDGILVVAAAYLLDREVYEPHVLLSLVAFYLLLKRLFITGLSVIGGIITLWFPVTKLFNIAVFFTICSLGLITIGYVQIGLITAYAFNSIVTTFSPQVAIGVNGNNHLQNISSVTTWWDMGSAIGALVGIFMLELLGREILFVGLTLLVTIIFINFIVQNGKRNSTILYSSLSLCQKKNK